jgi:phage-related protein
MPQTVIRLFRDVDGTIPLQEWLDDLEETEPRAYRKCLARILELAQFGYEMRRPNADTLRDGIHELRAKVGTVNYRILYFFMGANVACLSHGFTKESEIPDTEINRAVKRKRLVESDPDRYTAEWEA